MAVVRWNPTMPWRPFQQPWRPFQQPWRPFEGIESLRHEMDRLFEPFAGSTQPSGIRESEWIPRVDLLERENVFVLVADLPGMHQEDINVSVQDNVLTLEGKRALEHVGKWARPVSLQRASVRDLLPALSAQHRRQRGTDYGHL
jgi:HSP20 family molecular chaperone IbpA